MTRNRLSAKKAGTSFETSIVGYWAFHWDDRIERRARNGACDRGDISGLRHMGNRIVAECKNYGGEFKIGTWLTEVELERGNDDAAVGLVVAKRRGTTDPGDQVVILTVRDLTALVSGSRP
jgi:phytoene dehydrogenase-like protein